LSSRKCGNVTIGQWRCWDIDFKGLQENMIVIEIRVMIYKKMEG